MTTRPPAVADLFYPGDATVLGSLVTRLLAQQAPAIVLRPKVLIAPHAGYDYSGPVAACAYRLLEPLREQIRQVVLLGPSHRVYVRGMAVPSVDRFATPLGDVSVDTEAIARIAATPGVAIADEAHAMEHSLEVHLPFLQTVLADFSLVPIVVGNCPPTRVAEVLDALWDGAETLIVVSTDLSHFHPYTEAQRLDAHTSASIARKAADLVGEEACGASVVNGLMCTDAIQSLTVHTLEVRNSGDTAGDKSRVVGYGAFALTAER